MLTKYTVFRTRVSDEGPQSLRLYLAQEMQMYDATMNVTGGTNVYICRLLYKERVPLIVNERDGDNHSGRGLEWKLTIPS